MSERTIEMPGTMKTVRSFWSRRALLAGLFALCGALLLSGPAAAAPPAGPAWSIVASPYPSNFVPGAKGELTKLGPGYYVLATNVGGAATSGAFRITDTLPTGLGPAAASAESNDTRIHHFSCTILGRTVTCEGSEPIGPGEWVKALIPVDVEASSGSLENEATVEGGGAASASTVAPTTISAALPSFDFIPGAAGFSGITTNADGSPATQAGSHPYQLSIDLGFPTEVSEKTLAATGKAKDVVANLPRGVLVNPEATPVRCTEAQLESIDHPGGEPCPAASQVGTITTQTDLSGGIFPITAPLFNMVPPPGTPAEFAFEPLNAIGIYVHLFGGVRSDGDYGLFSTTREIVARPVDPVLGVKATLWGNPSDPSHDHLRGACSPATGTVQFSCPTERLDTAFLTMPSSCTEPQLTSASADSWEEPGVFHERGFAGPAIDGCNALEFEPTISAKPTTDVADSPSGLDFDLHQPQNQHYEGLATANLKDATVTLPAGLSVNPSGANGLGACGPAQIGLTTAVGQAAPVHFDKRPQSCPDAAKIGSLQVRTPLLADPLPGTIYIAKPYDNPFASLLAIYLVIEDEQTGIVAKLAGKVEPDPANGQLTTRFTENPELPLEDVALHLFGGARAALKTPSPCGEYATVSELVPWSTPEGANAQPSDSFQTTTAPGGGPCPASEAASPNQPAFTAGTLSPAAGAYSPFVLKLSREDGSQRLTAIDTTLPSGLLGKLAGISYCSEPQLAQAKSREAPEKGALEQSDPSCPSSSEVGTVTVGAGAGISPYYVTGHAYLAGPYRGAPLSLAIVTPAVAGPYDLGAVMVRTALYVDPESARIHAVSDPFPTILDGIPLDLRSVALRMDRPSFTLNPTSCDPMRVTGSATSALGQSAALSAPFQVGGCAALKFAPQLKLSLKGGTKRNRNPALKAILTYPGGSSANIASAQVTLPHSEFLDQSHIGTVCTRVQFAARSCPRASIYGYARATTPLLDNPVQGPVYLRSSVNPLPDLVADLNGQIQVVLAGRVDTGKGRGIRNTFEALPDAPVSRFVLEMRGGRRGLLVNSENICRKPQRAIADFTAQNGKVLDTKPLIANSCKSKAKKHKKHKAKKHPAKGRR
jgi:hypothetical protein